MTPANDILVSCPHCGGEKALMQIGSGNTFGGTQWWDTKRDFPMLPDLSPIQRCPHCGKFFFLSEAKRTRGEEYSGGTGDLNYEESLEAWEQLKGTADGYKLGVAALTVLFKYNDRYQREKRPMWGNDAQEKKEQPIPTDAEKALVKELVDILIKEEFESPLIRAEWLREVGEFDRAMEIVNGMERPEEEIYGLCYDNIKEMCAKKSTLVGIIPNDD